MLAVCFMLFVFYTYLYPADPPCQEEGGGGRHDLGGSAERGQGGCGGYAVRLSSRSRDVKDKGSGMQVIRFGAVGFLNTLIDFGMLNLLVLIFGATAGPPLVLCNVMAFAAASLNSYLLNKKWTFSEQSGSSLRQYLFFAAFAIGGLAVNSLVLYLLSTGLTRPSQLSPVLWVNMAKAGATAGSMTWNYLACRYIVFRKAAAARC